MKHRNQWDSMEYRNERKSRLNRTDEMFKEGYRAQEIADLLILSRATIYVYLCELGHTNGQSYKTSSKTIKKKVLQLKIENKRRISLMFCNWCNSDQSFTMANNG